MEIIMEPIRKKLTPLSEMRKISVLHMADLESETITTEVLPTPLQFPH